MPMRSVGQVGQGGVPCKGGLLGERSMRRALGEYVEHFHAEAEYHQGKGANVLSPTGPGCYVVRARDRIHHSKNPVGASTHRKDENHVGLQRRNAMTVGAAGVDTPRHENTSDPSECRAALERERLWKPVAFERLQMKAMRRRNQTKRVHALFPPVSQLNIRNAQLE